MLAARTTRTGELVRVGHGHEPVGDHQLENVLETKAAVLRRRRR
jgi:hypothetical protein